MIAEKEIVCEQSIIHLNGIIHHSYWSQYKFHYSCYFPELVSATPTADHSSVQLGEGAVENGRGGGVLEITDEIIFEDTAVYCAFTC